MAKSKVVRHEYILSQEIRELALHRETGPP